MASLPEPNSARYRDEAGFMTIPIIRFAAMMSSGR